MRISDWSSDVCSSDLLFASGSTELGAAGEKTVFVLAGVLRRLRNVIEIAGHADPQQPNGAYPTNWELSLARAAVLSGTLGKLGYEGEILEIGRASCRERVCQDV